MNIYYALQIFTLLTISYWAYETYIEMKKLDDETYSLY